MTHQTLEANHKDLKEQIRSLEERVTELEKLIRTQAQQITALQRSNSKLSSSTIMTRLIK